MSKVIEGVISKKILEDTIEKTAEGSVVMIMIEVVDISEVGIGLERDHFQVTMAVIEIEVQAIVDQGQDLEQVPIGIG